MESNNPNLGNDAEIEILNDELAPDTEQTTADVQEAAEHPVEIPPQAELIEEAEPQAEAEQVETEPVDAEQVDAEQVETEPDEAEVAAVDASVSEDAADAGQPDDVEPDAVEPEEDPEATAQEVVAEEPTVAEEPAEEPATEEDVAEEDVIEEEKPRFRKGDVIDGTVTETSPTEVMIDLGEGVVGVVASRELERMDRGALEALEVGNTVSAYILKMRGADKRPVLSLARAEEENNWRMAEEYHDTKQVYFSKVAGYNKGGLIVRFGKVRGFVPASQVSRERQSRAGGGSPEERWGHMVGEDIAVKVVEIDRSRNRLILSERAAAREWRERQKARLIEELEVGDVRTGRVISVADFGAFVDLGGADGLVHLTEISWQHITHPRDVLEVGQEVEVLVINIDRERKRIGLSMKRLESDPWSEILKNYEVGQLVQANVTKLTKFGAFARLIDSPEIEGLIHISELADYRVSHPKEVVLVGDVLTLRIVKINPEQRRLGLSLRQVDSARYMDQDWQAIYDDIEDSDDLDVADDD
jgi:small subunit ribosomal protein S1